MLTIHSEGTKKRRAQTELYGGELVAPFECPERVDMIVDRIREVGLGEIREPARSYDMAPVFAVHEPDYVAFLENAWDEWQAAGFEGEPIPSIWPTRRMRSDRIPKNIDGKIGYYALAAETSLCAHTFEAAQTSKDIALTALDHTFDTGEPVFGLCRPPGHHAAVDQFGGYCFFNNAAIAAQHALDKGAARIAILDIDFHHGNGTQSIFFGRKDVFYLSLHGDPNDAFPYFLGYPDEIGSGAGQGCNANYPLPSGADYGLWGAALDDAIRRIDEYRSDLLIVSLGVDAFKSDPISFFKLESNDFTDCGRRIGTLGIPTVFLLEGGYAVNEIGINVANVLRGFETDRS
jgi:acetoin utilization deacetylase AcuC-like enzyme